MARRRLVWARLAKIMTRARRERTVRPSGHAEPARPSGHAWPAAESAAWTRLQPTGTRSRLTRSKPRARSARLI
ncbi:hypothetical protein T492DRAFT_1088850 [Pavlovales sp. CCMP2436]|nr:hypothetical protein T492DRAFT_1088850 [Pavlovales sp. CCMP2436]